MQFDITAILVLMGIPSAVTGLCFWLIQKKIKKRDDEREEREKVREKCQILFIQSVGASIALGEATAIAIRNKKCNGETNDALAYARTAKYELKNFLTEQGIKSIFGEE